MRFLILSLALLLIPFASGAQSIETDLGVYASGIFFSDTLIAGERMRLYATIVNEGDEDVSGYVEFFQGSLPIGNSQVVSVRSGGNDDEVYVDFTVPSGSFNIRAEIRGTDPQDQNPSNDVAITTLFVPVLDDDRDGIPNDEDNCPSISNPDQQNSDTDEMGDACDDDDDNDGLTDDVEKELGTDPRNPDTDGDGVTDPNDAYPNDPSRSQIATPAPTPEPSVLGEVIENRSLEEDGGDESSGSDGAENAGAPGLDGKVLGESIENEGIDPSTLAMSPNSIFSFERVDWNKFAFKAITPMVDGYRYEWDFGDGVSSNRREVQHTYGDTGSFDVRLMIVDPSGKDSVDAAKIRVPFYTLSNPLVLGIVGLLTLLLLLGLLVASRFLFATDKKQHDEPEDDGEDTGAQKVTVRTE